MLPEPSVFTDCELKKKQHYRFVLSLDSHFHVKSPAPCQVAVICTYLIAQLAKNAPAVQETWVWSLGWKSPWRTERLPTPVVWPGEFHGLYPGCSHKESDTTERQSLALSFQFGWWHCYSFWAGDDIQWNRIAKANLLLL